MVLNIKRILPDFRKNIMLKKTLFYKILTKLTLQIRLLLVILSLLLITVSTVSYISYVKSKETAVHLIEQRLDREVMTIYDLAQNLMLLYVGNNEKFLDKMDSLIKRQEAGLAKDGLNGEYFFITEKGAEPFKISENSSIEFNHETLNLINNKLNGIIHTKLNGKMYTISFRDVQELKGIYTIAIPQEQYLQPVNEMARYIAIVALIGLMVTSLIIIFLVRGLTRPLSNLREVMRKVRDGNLELHVETSSTTPEITSLVKSFNAMIKQMRELLINITSTTNDLSATGEKLKITSSEVMEENEQLLSAIRVVKVGAEQTAISSEDSIHKFQEMKVSTQRIFNHMNVMNTKAAQINGTAGVGQKNSEVTYVTAIKIR